MIAHDRIEMFVRASSEGPYMVGGYASVGVRRTEPDRVYTLLTSAPGVLSFHDFRNLSDSRYEAESAACDSVGALVTSPIWNRASPPEGEAVLQLVMRRVIGQPRLAVFSGIIHDPHGVFGLEDGTFLAGDLSGGAVSGLTPVAGRPDMAGQSLSQVITAPIWELGADEPWSVPSTLRPDKEEMAHEARLIRNRMIMGDDSAEDRFRFSQLQEATMRAVTAPGSDETFDAVVRTLLESGVNPAETSIGLVTAADQNRVGEAMAEAIRSRLATEPSGL